MYINVYIFICTNRICLCKCYYCMQLDVLKAAEGKEALCSREFPSRNSV